MKEITTKSGKLLLVKVTPNCEYDLDKALYFSLYNLTLGRSEMTLSNPNLNCRDLEILGKFSELKDEDFEEFCELNNALKEAQKIFPRKDLSIHVDANNWKYTNYLFPHDYYFGLQYAKDSFETLVKSQGLDDDLDNYLIIKVL